VVFQRYLLPKGELEHRGRLVRPDLITDIRLLTVEGQNDDISGIGQTQAAHDLCSGLPAELKQDYVQPHVGHYGVFNGARFRAEIYPRVRSVIWEAELALSREPANAAKPKRVKAAKPPPAHGRSRLP
jgi:poly(3-hydroxybutyrate) depolymerase